MKEARVTFHTDEDVTSRVYECDGFRESAAGSLHLTMQSGETVAFFARGVWLHCETVKAEEDPA